MHRTVTSQYLTLATFILISACSNTTLVPEVKSGGQWTGVDQLDRLIEIVLSDDMDALQSVIQFTQSKCTFVEGLGGPPKCKEGEVEGETVEVLPFLGWEGHFIRKEDLGSWDGLSVSQVYAAYTVSAVEYTDPDYPRGTHAIVFIDEAQGSSVTLQIVAWQIVRIDLGLGPTPEIQEDDVDTYLLQP